MALVFALLANAARFGFIESVLYDPDAPAGQWYYAAWWYSLREWATYALAAGALACGVMRLATKRPQLVWPSLVVMGGIVLLSQEATSDSLAYPIALLAIVWGSCTHILPALIRRWKRSREIARLKPVSQK